MYKGTAVAMMKSLCIQTVQLYSSHPVDSAAQSSHRLATTKSLCRQYKIYVADREKKANQENSGV